ncbi:MAG: short-chain dehydrogenase [Acidocella sp. 20-57-95]|nr:MAG: short-chain dehydrogenase [Acidocella sp. 20-57-95]OYV59135.1 MAG: short-chain dehydrogenase [Acidocella sp. 21-58-7]HQT63847.1 SDR family oxidoreductase [Acidocella sp.]
MKLEGLVAIITGAGRNIGEDTAMLFAAEGAKVAVVDMDQVAGDRVAAQISAAGGVACGFVANVAIEADVQQLIQNIVAKWGRVDILINNAAITDNKTILDISKEEWDKVLAVTLTGPFLVAKYAAIQMVAQGWGGKIVNVASTSGFFGRPRAIAYTAAKGGVVNLTRSMAVQLGPHNIRVNCVVPNKIGSPVGKQEFDPSRPVLNLRGRTGVPADMAKALLFLVSDDSDFVVGNALFVDGGTSVILPGGA